MNDRSYYFEKMQKIANKYGLELSIIDDRFILKSATHERLLLNDIISIDRQTKWDSVLEIFDDLCRYIVSTIELKYNHNKYRDE